MKNFFRLWISIFIVLRIRVVTSNFVDEDDDEQFQREHFQRIDRLNSTIFKSILSRRNFGFPDEETIHFHGFSLLQIESNTFDHYPHLVTTIILSSNRLSNLPMDIFQPFESTLENLDLRQNRFYSLKNNSFLQPLKQLTDLDLSENQFEFIYQNDFRGLNNLETLILRQNHLTTISNSTFFHCRTIKTLDLSGNRLSFIDSAAFQHLSSLKILLLNDNRIGKHSLTSVLFSPLINVEFLDLENNRISFLRQFLFLFNQKLKSIKLRRNVFNSSNSLKRTFCGVSNLIEIDLVNTNLHSLDTCTYHQIPSLRRLYLMDNPLHCSCELFYLRNVNQWISETHRSPIELSILARCATPTKWSGYELNSLKDHYDQCHQRWNQLDRQCHNYCHWTQNYSSEVSSVSSRQKLTSLLLLLTSLLFF